MTKGANRFAEKAVESAGRVRSIPSLHSRPSNQHPRFTVEPEHLRRALLCQVLTPRTCTQESQTLILRVTVV